MKAPLQLTMAIAPDHRNQYLFSDHYLNNLLCQDPRWDAAMPEAETFLAWLQDLYAKEQDQLADYNESQLEVHWFRPILSQLGHVFEGQAGVPGLNAGVKRPDYVFFPDEGARQAAVGAQSTAEYTAEALAAGEVKRWNTPLGKKRKGGGPSFENQNPSWQIDYYLRATNLDWGILTGGRLWRLVHKDTSQRLSIYYEVDLVELLSRSDAGAMRYFTLLFRQAALRPDAQGRVFLDDALAASNAYAVALEEDLEENVYRALERLMQGFLDLPANGLGADDLREIYDNSLYLLYRLLFVLYGESRGLLPMNNDQYREQYSLEAIKEDIVNERAPTASLTTIIWGRLQALFHIINGDDAELNRLLGVPRYNGGLFDPQQHPFLDEKAVGDQALGEAVDLLSRRATEAGREFVDYRALDVRHLGSIYEGLLEYQPRIAREPMVAVGGGWVPETRPLGSSETLKVSNVVDRRDAGQVYLETDRGERKATGSYYTPQYIVAYIVEHTLGPLVDEAGERASQRESEKANGQPFVDAILNLKVLDPAMGSGHFLVEATDFLALALATDPNVETEATVEEDLTHWKRRVVERCIYGVDKNPLAVELTKLSLWLVTVAADRPLSFLDHHLKCGDSLIGARVDDLGEVPPVMLNKKALKERQARYEAGARQANLFETRLTEKLPVVMGRILEITEVESKDYDTVRAKEAADQAVRQLKAPFQAVADLWVSGYFGNEFINGEYDEALMHIGQPEALLALDAVQRARAMADERRFFHWELAFPEVFYDEHGRRLGERAGFDAVVGNPPYVKARMGEKMRIERRRIATLPSFVALKHMWDLYVAFMERSLQLLSFGGSFTFIIPDAFNTATYAESIKRIYLDALHVVSVSHYPNWNIFEDVGIHNIIPVVRKTSGDSKQSRRIIFDAPGDMNSLSSELVNNNAEELYTASAVERATTYSVPTISLGLLCFTSYGLRLNSHKDDPRKFRKQDLINSTPTQRYSKEYTEGKYLRRYVVAETRYLEWGTDRCPDRLVRPTFSELYRSPKLLLGRQTRHVVYDYGNLICDNTCMVCTFYRMLSDVDNSHIRRYFHNLAIERSKCEQSSKDYSLLYLCALLNSKALQHQLNTFRPGHIDAYPDDWKSLSVRRIEFTTPADERVQLAEEAKARGKKTIEALAASGALGSDAPLDQAMLSRAASPALAFVEERLAAEPEQADVVHDLLAHLAERMIEMHKQKQARVEDFWLDLEGVTDADAFEILRHKGKQERTLWRKAEACRPFVSEESHSTRRLDESLAWNEEAFKAFVKALAGKVRALSGLVNVYRAHSPAYRELVARIEATDWLIDQIVYKLYGLTGEEIAIVEGRLDHE